MPSLTRVATRCAACGSVLLLDIYVERGSVVGVTEESVARQELFASAHYGPFKAA